MLYGFTRGDRMPDIQRLDHAGQSRLLYDLQTGLPVLLLLFKDPEAADTRAALIEIAREERIWKQITRIALVEGTPAQCNRLLNGINDGLIALVDDGAVAAHLLGSTPDSQTRITAFAMDPNLRIIERLEYATDDNLVDFIQQIRSVYQRETPRIPQLIHQQAPVLFIPRVFDAGFCRELTDLFEKDGGQPSGVARIEGDKALWRPDPTVKMRRDVYIKEGIWLENIRSVLIRRVLPEIKRCFNYQVTQHEVFKLVRYDATTGGYFRPHRDNESRDTQHRRFAMTLNLNTGDYSGGQLRFPEFGSDLYQPERGGALVFSSSLLHEAMPVTEGSRYALLGFFFSDKETIQPVDYVSTS